MYAGIIMIDTKAHFLICVKRGVNLGSEEEFQPDFRFQICNKDKFTFFFVTKIFGLFLGDT